MRAFLLFIAMLLGLSPAVQAQFFTEPGEEPKHEIVGGLGVFDPIDEYTGGVFELEYRPPLRLFNLVRPNAGVFVNTHGGGMAYGGFGLEFSFNDRVAVMPFTAVGAYWQGEGSNGKDLGSTFQFRSGLEIGYFMDNGHRIAVQGLHISNANTFDRNPGTELFTVRYGLTF